MAVAGHPLRFVGKSRLPCEATLTILTGSAAPSSGLLRLNAVQVRRHRNPVLNGQAIRCAMATGKEQGAVSTASSGGQKNGGLRGKLKRVVLAYNGGLDTSVIVPWLRENYGCEVVCFTADVGQGAIELEGLEKKAKASGACQLVVKDLKEEFVSEYIYPCLRAGAVYERKYLLGTSMTRPLIVKVVVDVAKEVGADAVAHGSTGKENDQVRFEITFYALDPELKVVAPWREWDIIGREDAIEYLEIGIVAGVPVSINGRDLSPASLLAELNEIGGKHGIGRVDTVENRFVGMKGRCVYEAPGGTIMAAAVRELEPLTLDRETMQWKDTLALQYAQLVHAGRWFDPLRQAIDAFMEKLTATTTGSVTLKLYKGSVNVTSRKSPCSLYREDISSFENGEIYNQADTEGFIRLYGLPTRIRAILMLGKSI